MNIQVNPIQQLNTDNSGFQYLPTLLVDGKVTSIAGVDAVATYKEAEAIAQSYADTLNAKAQTGELSLNIDETTTSAEIVNQNRNVLILVQNTEERLSAIIDVYRANANAAMPLKAATAPEHLDELYAVTIEKGYAGFIHRYDEDDLRCYANSHGLDVVRLRRSPATDEQMNTIKAKLYKLKSDVTESLKTSPLIELHMAIDELKRLKHIL